MIAKGTFLRPFVAIFLVLLVCMSAKTACADPVDDFAGAVGLVHPGEFHRTVTALRRSGQLPADLPDREVEDIVLVQVASLQALAYAAGSRVVSVKCHGALCSDVNYDERSAQVMARTLYKFDPEIALVCRAQSPGARVARDCGVRVIEEACIDRAYDASGRVVRGDHPAALITDPATAVRQFLRLVERREVQTVDGKTLCLAATSFCLHSDTPNAAAIAAAIAQAIQSRGLSVRAPGTPCT